MRARLGHPLPILAASLIAVVLWASLPAPATAHARLAASDPANGAALGPMPATIVLTFTEPVAPGSVRVTATTTLAAEPAVSTGEVTVDGETVRFPLSGARPDPRTVTVAWRVVSGTDGHETAGLLVFSVGTGIPPRVDETSTGDDPRPISMALRAVALLGLALQAGAIVAGWLAMAQPRRLPLLGAMLAVVGLGVDTIDRDLLGRGAGQLLILAGALSMVTGVAVTLRRPLIGAVPWLGAVVAVVAAGHAAGDAHRLVATAVGAAHAGLGLAWTGTLIAVAGPWARNDAFTALRRLGPAALIGVTGLAAAGIALTALQVDGLRGLGDVTYGRLVVVKMALLAVALAVAAINRLVLLPRLPDARWAGLSRPVLAVESAILVGAIVVAGALSSTPPADGPRAVPVATRAIPVALRTTAGDLAIVVDAAILGAEDDTLRISVLSPSGLPVRDIQRLIVGTSVIRPGETAATPVARVDATAVTDQPGAFTLPATSLAVSGVWTLELTVRRAELEDRVGIISLDTTGWDFHPPRLVRDGWHWPSVPPSVPVLLATAALVLGVGFAGVRRSTTIEPLPAVIILAAIIAITAGFAVQALQQIAPATAGHGLMPPDGEPDLAAAAGNYRTYCLACHGVDGSGVDESDPLHDHGSGTDLLDADSRDRSDGDLFTLTGAGVSGTTMPAYDLALSEEERWALVAYLRAVQRDRPTPTP